MTFPSSASVVVVKGYWWADDGSGVPRQVTATPEVDHVTSASGRGVIDLVEKSATPDGENPYWELELVASNDPDLIPQFAWTFRMSGYDGAWTVTVPHDAALDSDDRPSVWLTELDSLVEVPEPQTSDYYYTKNQVDQKFTDHLGLSTPGWDPHPQYLLDTVTVSQPPQPLEVLTDSRFFNEGGSTWNLVTAADTPDGAVLVLVAVEDWGTLAGMPTPGGTSSSWTLLDSADIANDRTHMKVWRRTVSGGGAQTVTIGKNTVDPGETFAALYVLPPTSTVVAADVAVNSSASTTHTAPSVTATSAGQLVISAWIDDYTASGAGGLSWVYGAPPGAERSRATEVGSGGAATLLTATSTTAGAGATGPRTVTYGGAVPSVGATVVVSGPSVTVPYAESILSQVPSLEDIEGQAWIGTVNAVRWPPLTAANIDQRIAALSLVAAGDVVASDTNYWTVQLVRWRAGAASTIATRTTQTTAPNGGVAAYVPWTFDLVAFTGAQYLAKGDTLALKITPTGSPAALNDLTVSWRYEPGVTG